MILLLSIALAASLVGNYALARQRVKDIQLVNRWKAELKQAAAEAQADVSAVERRICDYCGSLSHLFRTIEGRGTVCRNCETK